VRAAPLPHTPALQAVGVDEWAWRRGHRYGTIVVALVMPRVVDLLPDRSAATVAAYQAIHRQRARGTPIAAIARSLGISRPTVYAYLRRDTPPGPKRPQWRPSARVVAFAIVCPAAQRSTEAQTYIDQLCQVDTGLARANALIQAFLTMVQERRGDARWHR
jgi:Transposase